MVDLQEEKPRSHFTDTKEPPKSSGVRWCQVLTAVVMMGGCKQGDGLEIVKHQTPQNYFAAGAEEGFNPAYICSLSMINIRIYGLRNPSRKGSSTVTLNVG